MFVSSREDLFSFEKRRVFGFVVFIFISVGMFRFWSLCFLRSVVGEEKFG